LLVWQLATEASKGREQKEAKRKKGKKETEKEKKGQQRAPCKHRTLDMHMVLRARGAKKRRGDLCQVARQNPRQQQGGRKED
jgi:hypothetical protein